MASARGSFDSGTTGLRRSRVIRTQFEAGGNDHMADHPSASAARPMAIARRRSTSPTRSAQASSVSDRTGGYVSDNANTDAAQSWQQQLDKAAERFVALYAKYWPMNS